jgi:biuret amidohydrolase
MAMDLRQLAAPPHTAVLTMEMQRGVVGDLAVLPELARAVSDAGIIEPTAALLRAARSAGAAVVHCTAEYRADGAASPANAPMLAALARTPGRLIKGSAEAALLPELGPDPADLVSPRSHGVSPFGGTSLGVILRNLGVRTVIATGVSVNIGIFGLAVEAVNLGFQVVLPTDCVTGLPAEYARAVVEHSLALLATRTSSAALIQAWAAP